MIDPAAIGARILEEMNRQQLSYRDVVEHTGISTGQLFRLFKGEGGYMRTDTLIRLCRYGCHLSIK